jgi:photosystem II stability/assembly factor-like uncharacterized protein
MPTQSDEIPGLLFVKRAAFSEQAQCLYGGWVCPSGKMQSLLRCTQDAGKEWRDIALASEQCSFFDNAQVYLDGQHGWLSCRRDGHSMLLTQDAGASWQLGGEISLQGDLLGWMFTSKKSGLAVITGSDGVAYVQKSSRDGGLTWETLLEISEEAAAGFEVSRELSARPREPVVENTVLQQVLEKGEPVFQLRHKDGRLLQQISWQERSVRCD